MHIIEQLMKNIDSYDLIVIFDTRTDHIRSLYKQFCMEGIHFKSNEVNKKKQPGILVAACTEEPCKDMKGISELRLISEEQMEELQSVFLLYEFTDKIVFLSEREQFASLVNYFTSGLLTYRQLMGAIFHGYIAL